MADGVEELDEDAEFIQGKSEGTAPKPFPELLEFGKLVKFGELILFPKVLVIELKYVNEKYMKYDYESSRQEKKK